MVGAGRDPRPDRALGPHRVRPRRLERRRGGRLCALSLAALGASCGVVAGAVGPGYFVSLAARRGGRRLARRLAQHAAAGRAGAVAQRRRRAGRRDRRRWSSTRRSRGVRGSTGGVFVGSFATGIVVGRWGCLFAGLPDRTYGTPTSLPWARRPRRRVARHPVQIYESLAMALFLALYLAGLAAPRAVGDAARLLRAVHLVRRAALRLGVPQALPNRWSGRLTSSTCLCVGLVIYGVAYWIRDLATSAPPRAPAPQGRALPVPRPDHQPL